MLESLRAMSQSKVPLKHAIIMNFNGAEEAILQVCISLTWQHITIRIAFGLAQTHDLQSADLSTFDLPDIDLMCYKSMT